MSTFGSPMRESAVRNAFVVEEYTVFCVCRSVRTDGIPVLTVFLNRVRVLQAREEPPLKLTSFKSAGSAFAHSAAVAAAEAFIGFRDLLDLIACKQQSAPIWEIQNQTSTALRPRAHAR